MSVLVTVKISGDSNAFQKALTERGDDFKKIGDRSRDVGAIHHRFGIGDGFVLVVDEWETAEQFQQFFNDPELHAFIGSVGGEPSSPPEITITEAASSPDEF